MDADYEANVEYVNAYLIMNPDEENGALLAVAVNQRVSAYNQLIAQRYGIMAKARAASEASISSSSSDEVIHMGV